ncbi:hypothetical protein GCM10009790_30280 [Georgenia ruanii]
MLAHDRSKRLQHLADSLVELWLAGVAAQHLVVDVLEIVEHGGAFLGVGSDEDVTGGKRRRRHAAEAGGSPRRRTIGATTPFRGAVREAGRAFRDEGDT